MPSFPFGQYDGTPTLLACGSIRAGHFETHKCTYLKDFVPTQYTPKKTRVQSFMVPLKITGNRQLKFRACAQKTPFSKPLPRCISKNVQSAMTSLKMRPKTATSSACCHRLQPAQRLDLIPINGFI